MSAEEGRGFQVYDLVSKDIKEFGKKLPRKPRVVKEDKKEDIKIIQDVKLAQSIAKEAISKHSDGSLNINIINVQSSNVNRLTKDQQEGDVEGTTSIPMVEGKKLVALPDCLGSNDELYHSVERVIEYLPSPKKENLIKIMYEIAYDKFDTTTGMARWLGVKRETLYYWFKKMGLLSPERVRELKVNKNGWLEESVTRERGRAEDE